MNFNFFEVSRIWVISINLMAFFIRSMVQNLFSFEGGGGGGGGGGLAKISSFFFSGMGVYLIFLVIFFGLTVDPGCTPTNQEKIKSTPWGFYLYPCTGGQTYRFYFVRR